MKTLPINRPTLDDPIYSQRNPDTAFLLLYSILVSIPVVFGFADLSPALSDSYGYSGVLAWSLCLLVGSTLAITGLFWRGHTWTALVLEAGGRSLLVIGALIFSVALISQHGYATGGMTAAYGISSAWRVGQIARRLSWLLRLIEEINRVETEIAKDQS